MMSSYRDKKFVHPLSKKIGRRTGRNVLAGKIIRRKDDGLENFDDYFSESDMDVTREMSRLHGVSEESDSAASQESKENHPSLSNIVTSSQHSNLSIADSKNHSSMSQSMPNSAYNTTAGRSTLSQEGHLNGTKFGWLRNKKIGRRTGKDVTANKKITLNEDGFENFDDYLSESDVSTVSSRLSVSMREARRSAHHEYVPSSLAKSSSVHSSGHYATDGTNTEDIHVTDLSDREVESQTTETEDEEVNDEVTDEEHSPIEQHVELSKTDGTSAVDISHDISDGEEYGSATDTPLENGENTTRGKMSVGEMCSNQIVTGGNSESHHHSQHSHQQSVSVHQSGRKSTTFHTESEVIESEDENDERLSEPDEDSIHNDDAEIEETVGEAVDEAVDEVPDKTNISHTVNISKSSRNNVPNTSSVYEDIYDETDDVEIEDQSDPAHDVVTQTVLDTQTVREIDGYDKSRTCTNIDVAGNLSGSITKLDAPSSVVSFDRTRKRLSYSALEKSEESILKHRKRIDVANQELTKETAPNPTKLSGELHVISKASNNSGHANVDDDDDDDCDIMCLTSRSRKQYNSDKSAEEADVDSDDDIVIMEEVKKTFIAHDKGKKSKLKVKSEKRTSNSISNDDVDYDTKKSRMVKSETKNRKTSKTAKNRRKTTHVVKEVQGSSEILENEVNKPVKGKRKTSSKQDSENIVNEFVHDAIGINPTEHAETHGVNDVIETNPTEYAETDGVNDDIETNPNEHAETDGVSFTDDYVNVGNEGDKSDEDSVSKNSKSKSVRTKESKSKKSHKAIKKKGKTVSAKKKDKLRKGKRLSHTVSEEYHDMDIVDKQAELESLIGGSKINRVTESLSKTSKTNKRKSSSDDTSESSPKVSKSSRSSGIFKSTSQKDSRSKRRKSSRSQSSSDDDRLHGNPSTATPVPDTSSVSTHFGSGVSFRVSRRSELLENIGSGYVGDVQVEMKPTGSLTPCITLPGALRRKKGRRVTLCPEENIEHEFGVEKTPSDHDNKYKTSAKFRHSYGMADATPLPSMNSTPVHIHEVTHTDTPHPGETTAEVIVDRLIKPSPPVEGLRRSARTRLKPVEWYKNERVVFDYRRRSGPAIIGVKPSLEVKYKQVEEQKRKKRLLHNQIKKAVLRSNRDKSDRKLSIHVDLPDDIEERPVQEITVYNQYSEMEDGINCVAKKDGCQPVGPNYGTPKKEDPYLITRLLSHPCMSAGKLCIKPHAEKPEHLVTADYLLFNIEYGKVLVKIHKTSTLLETGDIFMVPSGNTYSIQNLRSDNARLNYSLHQPVEDQDNDGRSLDEENL